MKNENLMQTTDLVRKDKNSRFYAITWRWHFYAGLYVVPFLIMLASTGLVMLFFTGFQSRLGGLVYVAPQGNVQSLGVQASAVLQEFPGGILKEYIAPKVSDLASWFVIEHHDRMDVVAVNPYTATVIKTVDAEHTLYAWAAKIHASLLLGGRGEHFIELAAGLGMVMLTTGLYLFWPRGSLTWRALLWPQWDAGRRKGWKSVHRSVGFWISGLLFLFLLTGMSWTSIWGGKLVQPLSTFPIVKSDKIPQSDSTHASLNAGDLREVPWGLELALLPASGSGAGSPGVAVGRAVNLDGVADLAQRLGIQGQYHINVPQSATGVYTISSDTMSGDLENPFLERTVHIDRYTGRILADVAYADYSWPAKAMTVGVALHQGVIGLWSVFLNLLLCIAVLTLCVSGITMWWLRRPKGAWRLNAPIRPTSAPLWKGGALVMLITAVLFPLAGGTLFAVLVLDWLLVSRISFLRKRLY